MVEIYSDESNFAVVRQPGRQYPGSLVQGDTLAMLVRVAEEASKALNNGDLALAKEAIEEISSLLAERLNHYEGVLKEHGLDLPYVRNT